MDKMSAIKSRQGARRLDRARRLDQARRSLLLRTSGSEISVSLDSSPHPATQSDEQSLIEAVRAISREQQQPPITAVSFDGNAWSNVPVASGTIDWLRVLDAVQDALGSQLALIELRHIPLEKICEGCGSAPKPREHRDLFSKEASSLERSGSFFEARLVLPLLEMLREGVFSKVDTLRLRWASAVVYSESFLTGRYCISNVLKFNYTLRRIIVTNCGNGDRVCEAIGNAIQRSNNSVHEIDLTHNDISPLGVGALAFAISLGFTGLRRLVLSNNPTIGSKGAFLLSKCLPKASAQFREIVLSRCSIGDKGGESFVTFLRLSRGKRDKWRPNAGPAGLVSLDLSLNPNMGADTRQALLDCRCAAAGGSAPDEDCCLTKVDLFEREHAPAAVAVSKQVQGQERTPKPTPRPWSAESAQSTSSRRGTWFGSYSIEEASAIRLWEADDSSTTV